MEDKNIFFGKQFNNDYILLDGAMGTMLQQGGMKLGELPEMLNFTNPQLINNIYKKYLQAGSDIIYANTFGANKHKVEGCEKTVTELVTEAIRLAKIQIKEFKDTNNINNKYVALDVGPIGTLLEPSGDMSFEEAYEIFKEIMVAGANAGADFVVLETMTDLYEVKAGVLACKENTDLPLFVTMTFEENKRTFTGCSIEAMASTLQGLGVDAIGLNCSLGPKEFLPLTKELTQFTNLPIVVKPNAGLPHPETGEYYITPKEFGDYMLKLRELGVLIMGGCCGSTPEFISNVATRIGDIVPNRNEYIPITKACTPTNVVTVDTVRVIGERINPTGKKRFAQALQNNEISYVLSQALEQVEAGADILDVNVGVPELDEKALMIKVVKELQSVVSVPLQIDSSDYDALEWGLRVYNGKPILNSVNGEDEKLDSILPLAKKYGASVVCLTIDEDGIPKTAEKRIEIALKILNRALSYGIPKEDILVDCLTLTVSAQQKDCMETIKALETLNRQYGLNQVLGVSNISFGLPNRPLINHSFLSMAMARGLTMPILNPNEKTMMDAVFSHRVLTGYDEDSLMYMDRFSDFAKTSSTPSPATNTSNENSSPKDILIESIMKGLLDQSREQAEILISTENPLEIVNNILIPTLDVVGQKFETGEFFLPQLLRSANASLSAFEVIKTELAKTSSETVSKGKIILATVHGDVHDIGKNIVKVILENYGYTIIDLGKDVPPELVVKTAIEENVYLVGLSALMTTTVSSMKKTIEQLRTSGHECKIMVGGAVLTEEYAMKIGADYYGKDAKASADIAKEVLQ